MSEILQCPDCASAVTTVCSCPSCGREFGDDEGAPVMMPTRPQTITFVSEPAQRDPRHEKASAAHSYPRQSGQVGTGIYHLDRGHAERLCDLPQGSLVVEIGCGGGQMRSWAKERQLRYLGTDISRDRVHRELREHGGPDLLCDVHALPIRSEVADAVYASAVWEHLAFPQLAAAEVARVLRPGGVFLGSASFLEPWHDASFYHTTPYGVQMTLTLAGLEPLFIWPEAEWPGFRAILSMGNKATKPLTPLGRLMNGVYLAPKALQALKRNRRWPDRRDLIEPISLVAGAVAWIARKPLRPETAANGGQA